MPIEPSVKKYAILWHLWCFDFNLYTKDRLFAMSEVRRDTTKSAWHITIHQEAFSDV
jgi:hypothetical protein